MLALFKLQTVSGPDSILHNMLDGSMSPQGIPLLTCSFFEFLNGIQMVFFGIKGEAGAEIRKMKIVFLEVPSFSGHPRYNAAIIEKIRITTFRL